jgi:hypothetical protein
MKDNLSLIAAAVGGFMLSVAAAGIVKAAPVTSLTPSSSLNSSPVVNLQTSFMSLRFEKSRKP